MYPPLYPDVVAQEYLLPQHDETLEFPEGRTARFVRFANEQPGVGFNNQLKELLLNTEIALLGGRLYVFGDIIWDPNTNDPYVAMPDEPDHNHLAHGAHYRAAKLPLRAFIDAPSSGSSWPPSNSFTAKLLGGSRTLPRSVGMAWYERMCPPERRYLVDTKEINQKMNLDLGNAEGLEIVSKWGKFLAGLDHEPCVEIVKGSDRLIDWNLLSNTRILSLWPSISKSPVLTGFKWSKTVLGAVGKNAARLWPDSYKGAVTGEDDNAIIPGLVTLHVRRKDFYWHCMWLGPWGVFDGWNQLSFLPDHFEPSSSSLSRSDYLVSRCWIEHDAIVARLAALRQEYPNETLDKVYVSTNEDQKWLGELEEKLKADGWKQVSSTLELELTWEESGVDNAIDMELASRGHIFIGNGFSSFTSTVVRLRLVDGTPAKYTRFW